MMKSMKKMISLLLVLLFAVSAFTTGCDSKPSNLTPNESTSSIPTTTKQEPTDKQSEEPVEITWYITMDLATNKSWTTENVPKLLKDKGFNVKFTVKELGDHAGEWGNKFKMAIASGDMPADIIAAGGLSREALDAGWYLELDMDLLNRTMPKYVAEVERVYPNMWAYSKEI